MNWFGKHSRQLFCLGVISVPLFMSTVASSQDSAYLLIISFSLFEDALPLKRNWFKLLISLSLSHSLAHSFIYIWLLDSFFSLLLDAPLGTKRKKAKK